MADIPGGNGNNNGTGGNDSEKMLQLLESANTKVSNLSGSIDNINKQLGKFSDGFNDAKESVELLNKQLDTLKRLGKDMKFPKFNFHGFDGAFGIRGNNNNGGSNKSTLEQLRARYQKALENRIKAEEKGKSSDEYFKSKREFEEASKQLDKALLKAQEDENKRLIEAKKQEIKEEINRIRARKASKEAREKELEKQAEQRAKEQVRLEKELEKQAEQWAKEQVKLEKEALEEKKKEIREEIARIKNRKAIKEAQDAKRLKDQEQLEKQAEQWAKEQAKLEKDALEEKKNAIKEEIERIRNRKEQKAAWEKEQQRLEEEAVKLKKAEINDEITRIKERKAKKEAYAAEEARIAAEEAGYHRDYSHGEKQEVYEQLFAKLDREAEEAGYHREYSHGEKQEVYEQLFAKSDREAEEASYQNRELTHDEKQAMYESLFANSGDYGKFTAEELEKANKESMQSMYESMFEEIELRDAETEALNREYEAYKRKQEAEEAEADALAKKTKLEQYRKSPEYFYKEIEESNAINKAREKAQRQYDADNPKDVIKNSILGRYNKETQRTLKALTDLGKQKGGPLGAISQFAQKLGANTPQMMMAVSAVTLLKKELESFSKAAKESQKTLATTAKNMQALGMAMTEEQQVQYEKTQEEMKLARMEKQVDYAKGRAWNKLIGNKADNLGNQLREWFLGTIMGATDDELPDIISEYLINTIPNAEQSGTSYQSAWNLSVGTYNTAKKYSGKFLQEPSEMAYNLADAWMNGSDSGAQYGLVMNDTVLAGYMQDVFGVDIVNQEVSEAFKQYYRYKMMLQQLETADASARQEEITKWTKLGKEIEKAKNQLFSFDEVISLNAYNPDWPEYGAGFAEIASGYTGESGDDTKPDIPPIEPPPTPPKKKDDTVGDTDPIPVKDEEEEKDTKHVRNVLDELLDLIKLRLKLPIGVPNKEPGLAGEPGTVTTPIPGKPEEEEEGLGAVASEPKGSLVTQLFQEFLRGALENFKANLGVGVPTDEKDGLGALYPGLAAALDTSPKEYGWAWEGKGKHRLIDVTGNENFIGQRYTFTPEQEKIMEALVADKEFSVWGHDMQAYYDIFNKAGVGEAKNTAGARTVSDLLNAGYAGDWANQGGTSLAGLLNPSDAQGDWVKENPVIASVLSNVLGLGNMFAKALGLNIDPFSDKAGNISELGGTGINMPLPGLPQGLPSGLPSGFTSPSLAFGFASGGIGTREINNATLFEGNKKEAVIPLESQEGIHFLSEAMKEANGGEGGAGSITVNLTLSGLNIANNQSDWDWVAQRIAENIDVQRQRRGELNYGASY